MNKLLLSALTVAMLSGTAMAYETATPGMMKAALQPISSRTLSTGEKEVTFGVPASVGLQGKRVTDFNFGKSFGRQAGTRADNEPFMQFNYAGNPYTACNTEVLDYTGEIETVYLTVYFSEMYTKMYNNCRLKDLTFVTGINGETEQNCIKNANIFIAKEQNDIPGNMVYNRSNKVTITEPWQGVTVDFKSDYIIKEGEPFYVGYAVAPGTNLDYFMVVDGMQTNDAYGALVGIAAPDGNMTWESVGPKVGNLCIYLTIVGDDLPKNGAIVNTLDVPVQVNPGEEFAVGIQAINMNSNDIKTLEYTYKVGNSEAVTGECELPEPLPYGQMVNFAIEGLTTDEISLNIPFEFSLTKVNGEDNYYPYGGATMMFKCFDTANGFTPHALIEEGTGTRCGYCPIGISMMEFATENYPEYYHLAALHYNMGGTTGADPMYIEANDTMEEYFLSLPSAYINRWCDFYPGNYLEGLPLFEKYYGKGNAAAGVTGLKVLPAENKKTTITADVKFALDIENAENYGLGFYITENELGPYPQLNYYAGMEGDYDGWESMPADYKKQYYNDVVRAVIGAAEGCENSLPASIKAGETYTYSVEADLANVEGETYKVIAFILDKESQEILNSTVLATDMAAAVEGIEAENMAKVYGVNGGIIIDGEYNSAEVISIDGKKVASVSGKDYVKLAAGIYIVNVDGKTSKVIVK